jgi:hypothetical protein
MLRNLVDELVRRRLWPIPAVALLVALAAPALFLTSAPAGVPAPIAPAPAGSELPARAKSLLAAGDARAARGGGASGSSHDPFEPPASHRPRAAGSSDKTTTTPSKDKSVDATPTEPIPVIIQSEDGSSPASGAPTAGDPASLGSTSGGSTSSATSGLRSGGSGSQAAPAGAPAIDVRFGKSADSPVQPSIAPLQPFFVHGKLAAVFVKYSPSRDKAVFAVSPGVVVTGPVACRLKDGVCYLDIPASSYGRLAMLSSDGTIVRRRLDVVRIDDTPASAGTTAPAATNDAENACLLRKLQTLEFTTVPVDRDACKR